MIYVSPAVEVGRDNHVEELVPVFRQASSLSTAMLLPSADEIAVFYQAIATNFTKKVLTDSPPY